MRSAFLITPFSPERTGGEDPQVYAAAQQAVAEAVASAGLELVHPKEMAAAGPIVDQVRYEIDQAAVVRRQTHCRKRPTNTPPLIAQRPSQDPIPAFGLATPGRRELRR